MEVVHKEAGQKEREAPTWTTNKLRYKQLNAAMSIIHDSAVYERGRRQRWSDTQSLESAREVGGEGRTGREQKKGKERKEESENQKTKKNRNVRQHKEKQV